MNTERPPLSSNGVDKFSINMYTTKCNLLFTCYARSNSTKVIQKKIRPIGSLLVFPIQMYVSLKRHLTSQTCRAKN